MFMKKVCFILMFLLAVFAWRSAEAGWEQAPGAGPGPLKGHSMTRIGNKIYVFGGQETGGRRAQLNYLWAYDEDNDEWQEEVPQNTPPLARAGHKSAAIDGMLYIFSGKSGGVELTDLWRYDPQTRTWQPIDVPGNWPPPRTDYGMVALDDRLYIFGGQSSGVVLNDLWYYNPASNSWNIRGIDSSVKARFGHSACANNGMIYFFGGNDGSGALNLFSRYDSLTDLWTIIDLNRAALPGPRYWHGAASIDGKMWLAGGKDAADNDMGETWGYDFATDSWTQQADGPVQSLGAAAAAGTGDLFLFGGENSGVLSGDSWRFTPEASPDAPTITSFSPRTGVQGTVVTITGTHFSGSAVVLGVQFGGTDAAAFTVHSSTSISATVGNGSTGAVTVTTTNGAAVSADIFTYGAPVPTLNEWAMILLALMLAGVSFQMLRRRREG